MLPSIDTGMFSAVAGRGAEPQEVLRAVLDALPWGLIVFDADRQVVFANSVALAFGDAELMV
ncbi:MAG TPA: hypothetical protein VHB50_00285, partial [Bryobacteraceae bacterium]|nr:hypothetical protein [Bryobacteraceae bacterium]